MRRSWADEEGRRRTVKREGEIKREEGTYK
jgi:hypothetical protein